MTTPTQPESAKVAIVTGASTEVRRATAAVIAREGMKVVLASRCAAPRRDDRLAEAVSPLIEAGHDVIGVPTNRASPDLHACGELTRSARTNSVTRRTQVTI